jgi:putative PIG3 family NAD(P)H quinone oxidoreductase
MRAITFEEPGDPTVLRMGAAPDPVPAPGEVLLRVEATAVNRADLLQRRGLYPPPPGASHILGLEAVGKVAAIPAGTRTHLKVGDRVMCLVGGGAYAEWLAVPAANTMSVPEGLSVTRAAAIPEVFLTAYQGLVRLGGLTRSDVALVHSIASGVGTAAAQICRAIGATCIGTSRSAGRAHAADRFGTHALHVPDGAFAHAVREETNGHGADVILDLVGAKYLKENIQTLARHGRIVLTGFVGGRRAELDMGSLLAVQGTILASSLRGRTTDEKAAIMRDFEAWAHPLFASGALEPVIHCVLPLSDAGSAHALLESDEVIGKVVLTVDQTV